MTTTELCLEAGVKRHSFNRLRDTLKLKPCGETKGRTGTTLYLWPQSALEKIRQYKAARNLVTDIRKGKVKA